MVYTWCAHVLVPCGIWWHAFLWYMVACFHLLSHCRLCYIVASTICLCYIFSYASRAVCLMASCVSGGVMSGKSSKVCGVACWSCLQDMCVLPATQVCLACNTGVSCLQHRCVLSATQVCLVCNTCVLCLQYHLPSCVWLSSHTPSFP